MPSKTKWYIVREANKVDARWSAYKVTQEDIDNLTDDFEWRGPFPNLVAVLIASGEKEGK